MMLVDAEGLVAGVFLALEDGELLTGGVPLTSLQVGDEDIHGLVQIVHALLVVGNHLGLLIGRKGSGLLGNEFLSFLRIGFDGGSEGDVIGLVCILRRFQVERELVKGLRDLFHREFQRSIGAGNGKGREAEETKEGRGGKLGHRGKDGGKNRKDKSRGNGLIFRMSGSRILVVGAGFSGAVIARELARELDTKVLVIDERPHVAGNCYTERDPKHGIMLHKYGAHIFHTDRDDVWTYIRQFSDFGPYVNRVKASTRRGVFPLPINLMTINNFFGKRFSPKEAQAFIAGLGDPTIGEPQNFEEQALKFVGREFYETFFLGYTKKQWGCDPRELPASLLKRLPIRFDYNDSYFNDRYQGIPIDGYTAIVERVLADERIEVKLGMAWQPGMESEFGHVIFTGPIDHYYQHRFGRLGYRTVFWEQAYHEGDFQGNAVINYPDQDVPFTRILEHKHFAPWEKHDHTAVFTEYSKETSPTDVPYYPKRLAPDKALLAKYRELAEAESRVSFVGRLATYRYLDMHQVVAEALDFAPTLAAAIRENKARPAFPAAAWV